MPALPFQSLRFFLQRALAALGLFATLPAGAADPGSVTAMATSPDGRYVATSHSSGELAVLDLEHPGALPIYSRSAQGSPAWSRDSNALVYAERFPGRPTSFWVLRPATGRSPAPLGPGVDWKAEPGWLDARRIVYLSDRDSDHVNLWVADTETTASQKLMDRGGDVSGLWVSPAPGEFIFRTAAAGTPELWWYWNPSSEPTRITQDAAGKPLFEDLVAFSPDGRKVFFLSDGLSGVEVVAFDLSRLIRTAALALEARPDALCAGREGEAVLAIEGKFFLWRPSEGKPGRLSRALDWNGSGLGHPARLGARSWAAVANGDLLITFDDVERVDRARIHARTPGDLVRLAARWDAAGESGPAIAMLESLWNGKSGTTAERFAIAATRALVERNRGKLKPAARALVEAGGLAQAGSEEALRTWQERLLLKLFDARDGDGARRLVEEMPEPARNYRLAAWARDVLQAEDSRSRKAWQRAGAAFRSKRWREAADLLRELIVPDPNSALHRRGIALLLQGDFDPLREPLAREAVRYPELLRQFRFQEMLLALSSADLSPEVSKKELRQLILAQWAEAGQREAARNLVLADLRDPEGSSFDYEAILLRFLDAEEQEKWALRAVTDVLLAPAIAFLLDRNMSDARGHLLLTLAKAKAAFIEGDREKLAQLTGQLERDLAVIPRDFWERDAVRMLLLVHVFRAKNFELSQRWDDAVSQYDRCAGVIVGDRRDWSLAPFDLNLARWVLDHARGDADLARTLLQVVRGLGDPLVNPAHEKATIMAGLANLQTLRNFAAQSWARPMIEYLEGSSLVLLGAPGRGVDFFAVARSLDPPKPLLARILIEEAAARGALGQHTLEAGLLARLCELDLSPPEMMVAIRARAQAEKTAGLIQSQENRMRYLCRELKLPRDWAAVLIADHTILPPEEGTQPPRRQGHQEER